MEESKTETFADKVEKNKSVIKIVELFFMKDIMDGVKESPSKILKLLDEEIIRVSDYYKNEESFNADITINLLKVLNERVYSPLYIELVLFNIAFHVYLNADENFKIHTDLILQINNLKKKEAFNDSKIISLLHDKIADNSKLFYSLNNVSEKED